MLSLFKKIFGSNNDRIIKKLYSQVHKVNALETSYSSLSDQDLKNKTHEFRELLKEGKNLDDIKSDAFAVVREVSKRVLGMRHFDVQILGGLILHDGSITEMRTGEGKTLVETLPAYLNALTGDGVHIVTPNDYLSSRDAKWMGKIFNFVGLTVGIVINGIDEEARRLAYKCDITYATNNELGFDYLRDNMKYDLESKVQRTHNYAIIDEIDSILIDEARTPLIISGPVDDNSDLYIKIDLLVKKLDPNLYEIDEKSKSISLKDEGINTIEGMLLQEKIINENSGLYDIENLLLVHHLNQALRANRLFRRDVDYVVNQGKIMIIDEFSGRIMEGRRYSDGLHQALEAKENVEIQNENQTLASITFQNYFRMYKKLSGMTGTAMTEATEFKEIYNLEVISVPPNIPVTRIDRDDEIYGNLKDKNDAILKQIKICYEKGQPILVGTISIEKSEELSTMLKKNDVPHNVLNAKQHEKEAYIIAQAGRLNAVTIATNMAGRGTDIMLGGNPEMLALENFNINESHPEYSEKLDIIKEEVAIEKKKVLELGGLYVLSTERHESRRIDNQLRGRAGRQGDPGETKFLLSLEDDLMRIFASERIAGLLRTLGLKDGEAIVHPMISRALEKAQSKVEVNNFEIRKNLLKFDDVMNDQRKNIFAQRDEIMYIDSVRDLILTMAEEIIEDLVKLYIPEGSYRENWDLDELQKELRRLANINIDKERIKFSDITEEDIKKDARKLFSDLVENKDKLYTQKIVDNASKYIFLATLDHVWKEHLHSLDHLRQGISLRAFGQKDPLNEYKREAFNMYEQMLSAVRDLFIQRFSHLHIDLSNIENKTLAIKHRPRVMQETREDPAFTKYNSKGRMVEAILLPNKINVRPEDRDPQNPDSWGKVSRNDLCPCNSGKKYKHCHGAV
jgi:preprotein translocase subunit SecA